MANAAAITVTDLTANSSAVAPTADALDTGTSAVTLSAAVGGACDRVILQVANTDNDTDMTVAVKAGDKPPALRAGLGDLSVTVAFGTTRNIGPFDPSRFLQDDGTITVVFTPASGTISATVRCYRLPKAA